MPVLLFYTLLGAWLSPPFCVGVHGMEIILFIVLGGGGKRIGGMDASVILVLD